MREQLSDADLNQWASATSGCFVGEGADGFYLYSDGGLNLGRVRASPALVTQAAEMAELRAENERMTAMIQAAGGFHERTEREVNIEQQVRKSDPPGVRGWYDVAIEDLLVLIDGARNRLWQADAELANLRQSTLTAGVVEEIRDALDAAAFELRESDYVELPKHIRSILSKLPPAQQKEESK